MSTEPDEATTTLLPPETAHENVLALKYGPHFLDELAGLAAARGPYDVVVVRSTEGGFLFPTEAVVEAGRLARKMLTLQGALVFASAGQALALVRESLMGQLSIHIFDSMGELYDYSPAIARHVQSASGQSVADGPEGTDLGKQVLMSSVPVLTPFGIKLKAGMESSRRRNMVLATIDNYTPISAIEQRLVGQGRLTHDELIEEMRSLEQVRAIFPVFAKAPFLVHCFRNQIPFKLRDYLIASRLVTQSQLDELLFEQQGRAKQRLSLGALCVARGYLSTRQLEIALQDQAFYGQAGESEKVKLVAGAGERAQVQSLVGHLGTTDPAGLLQNLATTRENGVLSVENKDLQFRALYENGRLLNAKLSKIQGNRAVIEFVSVWTEGIFVFIQRQPPADLADEACKLTKPLDKLLLDAALASDNQTLVWKKLPKGVKSALEKLPDSDGVWQGGRLVDPQDKKALASRDLEVMQRLWKAFDGLTPLAATIRSLGDITTYEAAVAVDRLLHYGLVSAPAMDVSGPLVKFQQIVKGVGAKIGVERNTALLRLSLQATQGYSVRARMFSIGAHAEVGIDLAAARSAGTSLSMILKDLEDWQVKYIEYVSQEVDRNILRDIVYGVHQSS